MKQKIPLFKIYWDEADIDLTTAALKRGAYWAAGPEITTFETLISEYIGPRYCLVFNSGTSALHAILLAYGIGPGDEVIVPSFTFIATANAALFVGAKPVFADIEDVTYGLDPVDVEKKITAKTRAIIPVHYGGIPCQVEKLREIADAHGILLIEDAAEAFGAKIGPRKVGTFGQSTILSFCQNKVITTGEGGAIVTDDAAIYEKLKLIRSQGRLETADYFNSTDFLDYVTLGYNFRLSNISAALGVAQIKKVDEIIGMRRSKAACLTRQLSSLEQIVTLKIPPQYFNVYQMYPVRITEGNTFSRNGLMKHLEKNGVMTKVNFYPVHLTRLYRDKFGYQAGVLPVTETVSNQILTLPIYPALSEEEIEYIADKVKDYFSGENVQ
jgi:perosamine synthetase